jgi:ElaB/YqjD/DUF883 family membrane-anchored ribosome-binding protein
MADIPPNKSEPRSEDLAAEFRNLGNNLNEMFRSAWESEERKKLQQEIETGLTELGKSLNKTVDELKVSPAGQRLKTEVHDFHQRVRSGDIETELRENLVSVLRKINSELEKAAAHKTDSAPDQEESPKEG